MLWIIYNFLFAIGYVLLLPRFLLRMWRRGGYREGFLQRLGVYAPHIAGRLRLQPRIWIHAVSVGEVYVALRFIREIRTLNPKAAFILTTTTSTGRKIAQARIGADDVLLYFPTDFPCVARRALRILKPTAILLTECELWPNLILRAKKTHIPVILINGRISDSSYRGYKALRVFFSKVVGSIDLLLAQTDEDKKRLLALGAAHAAIKVMGSAKYDLMEFNGSGKAALVELPESYGFDSGSLLIVGGSTWPGEEAILLRVYKRLKNSFANLKLILVPRHVERKAQVAGEIQKYGLSYLTRSELPAGLRPSKDAANVADVLLVDTTGELMSFYARATVVFVGKSLTSHGGQNIIECAFWGKPIVVGPHTENFAVVMSDFLADEAVIQVADETELETTFRSLLADEDMRKTYGCRAAAVVKRHQGVVRRSVEAMRELTHILR